MEPQRWLPFEDGGMNLQGGRPLLAGAAVCLLLAGAARASGARDSAPREFRAWVDARAGTGEAVHWIAEGAVYAYPSGEKLFGMTGFDSSTVIWPDTAGVEAIHLTRKTFAYTDPDTGEVLERYAGRPVESIAYPYQLIRYRLSEGVIHADVEQGSGEHLRTIPSQGGMRIGWLGADTMTVTAPVFLDFPLPGGTRYEAWENYDFFIHLGGEIDEPYQMSWQRFGDLPAWAGDGKAIYHLRSWRVESLAEFPPALLAWAEAKRPGWLKPPADLAEIRALQQGTGPRSP